MRGSRDPPTKKVSGPPANYDRYTCQVDIRNTRKQTLRIPGLLSLDSTASLYKVKPTRGMIPHSIPCRTQTPWIPGLRPLASTASLYKVKVTRGMISHSVPCRHEIPIHLGVSSTPQPHKDKTYHYCTPHIWRRRQISTIRAANNTTHYL